MKKDLPFDYFLDVDDEMLVYMEEQGLALANEIQTVNERIRSKAYSLLNYLILGIGGLAIGIVNGAGVINPVILCSLLILMIAWSVAGIVVIQGVILCKIKPSVFGSPFNLYKKHKDKEMSNKLGVSRRYKLWNTDNVIGQFKAVNVRYAKHTDLAMIIATFSPAILLIINALLVLLA